MNESQIHRALVKAYLLYFESCALIEKRFSRRSYLRSMRFLNYVTALSKKRRAELRAIYKNDPAQIARISRPAYIERRNKDIAALRAKIQERKNKKD